MPTITAQAIAKHALGALLATCLLLISNDAQAQTREQTHWSEIKALAGPSRSTESFDEHFNLMLKRKQHLLQRIQLYQSLYPGGAHRDRAIQLELETLFEIGCLRGGEFHDLCERAAQHQSKPPCESAEQEAAFWLMRCERLDRPIATSVPTTPQGGASEASLLEAYRAYVRRYPESRHTPRLCITLFEDALARKDIVPMRQIVDRLSAKFPQQQITQTLAGRLQRAEALGRPFLWSFDTTRGETLELDSLRGQPILIVVWTSADNESIRRLQEIETFRSRTANLQTIGVSLDSNPATMFATCRDLAIEWPQHQDGLGSAGAFVRAWGVRQTPFCFVLDRNGNLLGASDDQNWRPWCAQALKH